MGLKQRDVIKQLLEEFDGFVHRVTPAKPIKGVYAVIVDMMVIFRLYTSLTKVNAGASAPVIDIVQMFVLAIMFRTRKLYPGVELVHLVWDNGQNVSLAKFEEQSKRSEVNERQRRAAAPRKQADEAEPVFTAHRTTPIAHVFDPYTGKTIDVALAAADRTQRVEAIRVLTQAILAALGADMHAAQHGYDAPRDTPQRTNNMPFDVTIHHSNVLPTALARTIADVAQADYLRATTGGLADIPLVLMRGSSRLDVAPLAFWNRGAGEGDELFSLLTREPLCRTRIVPGFLSTQLDTLARYLHTTATLYPPPPPATRDTYIVVYATNDSDMSLVGTVVPEMAGVDVGARRRLQVFMEGFDTRSASGSDGITVMSLDALRRGILSSTSVRARRVCRRRRRRRLTSEAQRCRRAYRTLWRRSGRSC